MVSIVYIFVEREFEIQLKFITKILFKYDLIFTNAGVSALNTQRRDFSGKFFELLEINILGVY